MTSETDKRSVISGVAEEDEPDYLEANGLVRLGQSDGNIHTVILLVK